MHDTTAPALRPPVVPGKSLAAIFPAPVAVLGREYGPLSLASVAALARMSSPALSGQGRIDLPAAIDVLFVASLDHAALGRAMAMQVDALREFDGDAVSR